MSGTSSELFAIERKLAGGAGDTYRRHLAPDAIVVVPGATLDRDATVKAMDAPPGWNEFSFDEKSVRRLGDGVALLRYRFRGSRDGSKYEAILTSVYVKDDDEGWKLAHHQQTPVST